MIFKILIILLCGIHITMNAFSCSCQYRPTTREEYSKADLVIEGKVLSFDTIETTDAVYLRFKIYIIEDFKTTYNVADTIYVLTSSSMAGCRYPFVPTRDYLIYANAAEFKPRKKRRRTDLKVDTFVTSICRLTQESNIEEKNRLKELKE